MTSKSLADAFRGAKQHLWDGLPLRVGDLIRPSGGTSLICSALDAWAKGHPERKTAARKAQALIHKRLYPYASVNTWLWAQGHLEDLLVVRRKPNNYNQQVQAYRHRWLDALVKEFENDDP